MIRQLILVFSLLLLVALNAEARTYIQCAGSASDRAVVNVDGENSTLFMTSGVDDPNEIRVLKKIKQHLETESDIEFLSEDEELLVSVPKTAIGNILSYFKVTLTFLESDYDYELTCYSNVFKSSAIYSGQFFSR